MENLCFDIDRLPPSQQSLSLLYNLINSITEDCTGYRKSLFTNTKGKLISRGGNQIHISQRMDNSTNIPLVAIIIMQDCKVICEYQLDKDSDGMTFDRYSTLYPSQNKDDVITDPLKLEKYLGITRTTELEAQTLISILQEEAKT